MHVVKAEPLSVEEWERLDREAPAPTFLARPAWARAWCEAMTGYEPFPLRCTFDDGKSVIVPMLREHSKIGWQTGVAMPWNVPVVLTDEQGRIVENERCKIALRHLTDRIFVHRLTVTLWPLCDQGSLQLNASCQSHETSVIDLRDGLDAATERMDGRSRRMAGQALRHGVRCARASESNAIEIYWSLLVDSAKRWGRESPTISRPLLEAVVARGGNDAEVWFAYYDERPIAGGIVLLGATELFFWSAAMNAEFSHLRPSNALNLELLRSAAERGIRWYNLGSSEGLPGVQAFKDRLGAKHIPYRTLRFEGVLHRAYVSSAKLGRMVSNFLGRKPALK
jgi:hypothetical protein